MSDTYAMSSDVRESFCENIALWDSFVWGVLKFAHLQLVYSRYTIYAWRGPSQTASQVWNIHGRVKFQELRPFNILIVLAHSTGTNVTTINIIILNVSSFQQQYINIIV